MIALFALLNLMKISITLFVPKQKIGTFYALQINAQPNKANKFDKGICLKIKTYAKTDTTSTHYSVYWL